MQEFEGPAPTVPIHRSETVERIAGITNRGTIPTSPEHGEAKPIKEQWVRNNDTKVMVVKTTYL